MSSRSPLTTHACNCSLTSAVRSVFGWGISIISAFEFFHLALQVLAAIGHNTAKAVNAHCCCCCCCEIGESSSMGHWYKVSHRHRSPKRPVQYPSPLENSTSLVVDLEMEPAQRESAWSQCPPYINRVNSNNDRRLSRQYNNGRPAAAKTTSC